MTPVLEAVLSKVTRWEPPQDELGKNNEGESCVSEGLHYHEFLAHLVFIGAADRPVFAPRDRRMT